MKILTTALVATVLAGSASAAFADEPFDVNIYRPVFHEDALSARAQVPRQINGPNVRQAVQPFRPEEKALFERMSRPE